MAKFLISSDPASVQSAVEPVGLLHAGETTLHAELAGPHAELRVQVAASSPAENSPGDIDAGP